MVCWLGQHLYWYQYEKTRMRKYLWLFIFFIFSFLILKCIVSMGNQLNSKLIVFFQHLFRTFLIQLNQKSYMIQRKHMDQRRLELSLWWHLFVVELEKQNCVRLWLDILDYQNSSCRVYVLPDHLLDWKTWHSNNQILLYILNRAWEIALPLLSQEYFIFATRVSTVHLPIFSFQFFPF